MKFGEKVRDLRKKHSLTQDELAQCLGINKRTIIGWERDGRYPRSIEMLEKMADIFHVPLTYLQPDQSLFIERAAEAYGKKGKIEAQHLAFELTELFASGELTPQDMDGIMYEMHKAYFKYREQKREKERMVLIKFLPFKPNTHAMRTMKYFSSVWLTASSPSSFVWPYTFKGL